MGQLGQVGKNMNSVKIDKEARRFEAEDQTLALAARLIETVPLIMYHIRSNALRHGQSLTSLPQTRVLAFINNCPGSSLSRLAESLAVTRASASTMVDKLVRSQLVVRTTDPIDRRNVILSLTAAGESQLKAARRAAIEELAAVVEQLPGEKLVTLEESLSLLKDVFSQANANLSKRSC